MRCQWQKLLDLLPVWMRKEVDKYGMESLQEIRLRVLAEPELVFNRGCVFLERRICKEDLEFSINMASRYSPWAATSVSKGYLTALGGHRIGLCGDAIMKDGQMQGIRAVNSLCIRVAKDIPGVSGALKWNGSILIIGKPGSGKTTFLRDYIRQVSDRGDGSITVIDERAEIFPYANNMPCFPTGKHTDVLTGCSKSLGIDMALRTMGPKMIALDEITAKEDCTAMLRAGWCGVYLAATAHAGSKEDFLTRPIYQPIVKSGLFDQIVVLQPDKSWRLERI